MSSDRSRGGPMSASDFLQQLADDPEFQAAKAEQDRQMAEKVAVWRRAEAPLAAELRDAGYQVDTAWDLVNTAVPYPDALPILVRHLGCDYPDRVREGIARALAVRPAAPWWDDIARCYREATEHDAKHGLAVALSVAVTRETLPALIDLIDDPDNGDSRILLLRGLKRVKDPRGLEKLEALTTDPALGKQAKLLLPKKRSPRQNQQSTSGKKSDGK